MEEKIQKTNILYLLAYIFAPILICALCYWICYLCFYDGGTGAVLTTMVPTIAAFIWWIFGGSFIFKKKTKELEKEFVDKGYRRNQTFYGKGKTVVLDIEKGMLGLAFFWNPFKTYIVPASRVQKAWTDDGKMGSGFMEGSSQVKFVFTVDDIKISVPTFQSNQRFRMDDKHILTGISKADMMVKSIEEAKANSTSRRSREKNSEASSSETTPEILTTKLTAKSNEKDSKKDAKKSEK